MTDTFAGTGIKSIIKPLTPRGTGWKELPADQRFTMGFPLRCFLHEESRLFVMSAVETMANEDKGPEYHISVSKAIAPGIIGYADSNETKWILEQFKLEGAEEDNHAPNGKVRNFWRTIATPLIGMECKCKDDEPEIKANKGDYIWRAEL